MSTRQTKRVHGPFHLFWDVIAESWFLDIGRHSYGHAFEVWPPTFRLLYGGQWMERFWPKHPQLKRELRKDI